MPTTKRDLVNERRIRQIFHQVSVWKSGGQLQIGCQADRGVPSVRDEANSVFLSHPGDSSFLADATDFRHVRLHDIKRARLQPGLKRLSTCQDLATCDGNR